MKLFRRSCTIQNIALKTYKWTPVLEVLRLKYSNAGLSPIQVEKKRAREDKSVRWAKPLLEHAEKKKQRELDATEQEKEPHMIHVVRRIKPLKGRPWWEKEICEEFGLEAKMHQPVPLKNSAAVNEKLNHIKHLVQIQPLTFPHGVPEHDSDFQHTLLKSNGELVVRKKLPEFEPRETEEQEQQQPAMVTLETVDKDLVKIRQNFSIHKEYFPTTYLYKRNQDGQEYRYKQFPFKTARERDQGSS